MITLLMKLKNLKMIIVKYLAIVIWNNKYKKQEIMNRKVVDMQKLINKYLRKREVAEISQMTQINNSNYLISKNSKKIC